MLRTLLFLVASIVRSAIALFRTRENQAIVELALRQQLAVYVHRHPRPRLSPLDRTFWIFLSRFWLSVPIIHLRAEHRSSGSFGPGVTVVQASHPR
jgi:hypothetical protein